MKRLLTGALALLLSLAASATTLNPVQLLNPAGSTSGQAIVSTGASTAPAWSNMAVANVTGAAALTGANFTGNVKVTGNNLGFIQDASAGQFRLNTISTSGVARWQFGADNSTESGSNAGSNYTLTAFSDAGTFLSQPIVVTRSTGGVVMAGGVTGTPISGSTGSFTTLAASGLITPSSTIGIKGTTTNDNANAGSVGEFTSNSTLTTSVTTLTPVNATSVSLTAGDWEVSGVVRTNPAGTTVINQTFAGVSTTSATFGAFGTFASSQKVAGTAGGNSVFYAPVVRISLASTTTVFLVANVDFGTSTCTVDGFIRARRVR